MVIINGAAQDIAGSTLKAYLDAHGYDQERIAVERNEEIIPKAQYAQSVFEDGDVVEIVTFVGGG